MVLAGVPPSPSRTRDPRSEANVLAPRVPEQDEYSILNSKHFIGIHGYMLVYSVASLPTFEMVQVIRDKILDRLVSSLSESYRASAS